MQRARLITLFMVVGLAGCGSADQPPPAAEPAVSPALSEPPAGRTVELGDEPEGIVADPATGLVAVGLRNPDRLALVDGRTGEAARSIRLPESPRHLQLAAPGGPVLAPAERADRLVRVALPSGRIDATQTGAFPHEAVATGSVIAVTDEMGDTLSLLTDSGTRRAIETARQPGGVAAVGTHAVAVVAVRDRVVELFDTAAGRRIGAVDAGVGPTHVVADPRSHRLFVADTQGDALLVLDTEPRLRINDRLALPGSPYGLALDPRRRRLWVTLTASNRLVELELAQRAPMRLRAYPTVRQPNSVAVDERTGTVYVAGRLDGRLQIVASRR